ncbi:MAG: prefoldin subunit alpha [Nitrososphaeria archaeon]
MSKTDKEIEQELQTKIIQIRYLEEYLEDLAGRENMAITTLNDIQNAEETIEELSKGKDLDTMVYIGGGMYTSSKINITQKVLVNVGYNIVVEKTLKNAQTFLEERKKEIRTALGDLSQQKQQAAYALQRLRADVESALRRGQSE